MFFLGLGWSLSKKLLKLNNIFGILQLCIVDCGKRSKTNKRPGPDD